MTPRRALVIRVKRSDFHFDLPPELIAQRPLAQRSASRLLALDGDGTTPRDLLFTDLPEQLRPGDLLVFNNTRVMRARLFGHKDSGGAVEVLIERLLGPTRAQAQVRASKSPRPGSLIRLGGGGRLEVLGRDADLFLLRALDQPFPLLMQTQGHVPLPPYLERPD